MGKASGAVVKIGSMSEARTRPRAHAIAALECKALP